MEEENLQVEMQRPKKRRHRWTEEDDAMLIEIWGKYHKELRKHKRNSHIYAIIAEKMGGMFTAQEAHCKIKNLTARYRAEKQMDSFGGPSSNWIHFERVHQIVGGNCADNSDAESNPLCSIIKSEPEQVGSPCESSSSWAHYQNEHDINITDSARSDLSIQAKRNPTRESYMIASSETPHSENTEFTERTSQKLMNQESERQSCWSALVESTRVKSDNEKFGQFVSGSLDQIKNHKLVENVKCKIRLLLSHAITVDVKSQLKLQPGMDALDPLQ